MHKPAPSDWPIHELLRRRWSPRAFADRPVEREKLLTLLEAMRWAPSSYNEQPWSVLIATRDDPAAFAQMLQCLVPANQAWAKHAPVLMIVAAKTIFERNAKPNRHAMHDVGLALGHLTVQATAIDLFVHMMAGFDVELTRQVYQVPDTHEPATAVAIGYAGDPQDLDDERRRNELAPRRRKPLDSFVFTGLWGRVAPVLGG